MCRFFAGYSSVPFFSADTDGEYLYLAVFFAVPGTSFLAVPISAVPGTAKYGGTFLAVMKYGGTHLALMKYLDVVAMPD